MSATAERLAATLREEGGLLAQAVAASAGEKRQPALALGEQAASGPRASGRREQYALLVEAIHEGYLLHYGEPRVVRTADPDLALLAGDRLYALGLARLAELGDLEAIVELADVISLCALAHAASSPELAAAVWEAGAVAVGWGGDEGHRLAKASARSLAPGAAEALRRSAAARRSSTR